MRDTGSDSGQLAAPTSCRFPSGGRHRAPDGEPAQAVPYPREPPGEPWEPFDSGSLGTTTLRSLDARGGVLPRRQVDWLAER
jgi:hypothetical protein